MRINLLIKNSLILNYCQYMLICPQMKHPINVGITFNRNGGGTISFRRPGNSVEALKEFLTIRDGYDTVSKLLHEGNITKDDADALNQSLKEFKVPAETPTPEIRNLTAVLSGTIIIPREADIRKYG